MEEIGYMPLNGGIMGQATGLFDFWQTGQLATGLITIDCNWQLQSSCDQLRSSPVASLCTSCQLDFETLGGLDMVFKGLTGFTGGVKVGGIIVAGLTEVGMWGRGWLVD